MPRVRARPAPSWLVLGCLCGALLEFLFLRLGLVGLGFGLRLVGVVFRLALVLLRSPFRFQIWVVGEIARGLLDLALRFFECTHEGSSPAVVGSWSTRATRNRKQATYELRRSATRSRVTRPPTGRKSFEAGIA